MSHGSLICRECYTEADMRTIAREDDTAGTGLVCPNCGSESFSI